MGIDPQFPFSGLTDAQRLEFASRRDLLMGGAPGEGMPRTNFNSFWDIASRNYASAAVGEVRYIAVAPTTPEGQLFFERSIFAKSELPALLNNANVTTIAGVPREALLAMDSALVRDFVIAAADSQVSLFKLSGTNLQDYLAALSTADMGGTLVTREGLAASGSHLTYLFENDADAFNRVMAANDDVRHWAASQSQVGGGSLAVRSIAPLALTLGLWGATLQASEASEQGDDERAKEIMERWAAETAGSEIAAFGAGLVAGIGTAALVAAGVISAPVAAAIVFAAALVGGFVGAEGAAQLYELTKDRDLNERLDLMDRLANAYFGVRPSITDGLPRDIDLDNVYDMPRNLTASNIASSSFLNISWRYALRELNPFVIEHLDYAVHNTDGSLDLYNYHTGDGAMTDRYIRDRSMFLEWYTRYWRSELDDNDSPRLSSRPFNEPWHSNSVVGNFDYIDLSTTFSGNEPLHLEIDGVGITMSDHQIVFGSSQSEVILGSGTSDSLYGMGGDDELIGNDGDDYLEGGSGDDWANGGNGNDVLFGMSGNDILSGDDGNDQLDGGLGIDTMHGGDGDDELFGGRDDDTLNGDEGDDSLVGGLGSDTLFGGRGNDTLDGGDGFDLFHFFESDFSVESPTFDRIQDSDGWGSVLFEGSAISSEWSLLSFDGGSREGAWESSDGRFMLIRTAENDGGFQLTIRHVESGSRILIKQTEITQFGFDLPETPNQPGSGGSTGSLQDGEGDDLVSGNIVARNDHFSGTSGNDALDGGLGNDTLSGGNGNDLLLTGSGDNVAYGGSGDDVVIASTASVHFVRDMSESERGAWNAAHANDPGVIYVGEGWLIGSSYAQAPINEFFGQLPLGFSVFDRSSDNFHAILFHDAEVGGNPIAPNGVDRVYAGDGDDYVSTHEGNDFIQGDNGRDTIIGGFDHDVIVGGADADFLWGDYRNVGPVNEQDQVYAWRTSSATLQGNDFIDGGSGDDRIFGGGGHDDLKGGTGDDYLEGDDLSEVGNSDLHEFDGADLIDGGAGNDLIHGGGGNDVLLGGDGNDQIDGDYEAGARSLDGDDLIDGGAGNDLLLGMGGNDEVRGGADNDQIFGDGGALDPIHHGNDRLFGDSGNDTVRGQGGDDQISGGSGNDTLLGDAGDDVILGGTGNDVASGGAGNDQFAGGTGNDLAFGDDGNDRLAGGEGDDLMGGDAGDDQLFGNAGDDRIAGGDGSDAIYGGGGNDMALGGAGNDAMHGESGDDVFAGEAGDDAMQGGYGHDTLYGGQGDDSLDGGEGDDYLEGGDGADTLSGGAGRDILVGGAGNDVLIAGAGNDVLVGGAGDDTYVIAEGAARVRIASGTGDLGADVIRVGGAVADTSYERTGDTLVIRAGGTRIDVEGYFRNAGASIQFGDGSIMTAAQVGALAVVVDEGMNTQATSVVLSGTDGADRLVAGYADTRLEGGQGNDELIGMQGDDTLIGGAGDDFLDGGHGLDTYIFDANFGHDTIDLGTITGDSEDILQFNFDFPESIRVRRLDAYHLVLDFGGSSLTLKNPDLLNDFTLTFADGTTISRDDLFGVWFGTTRGIDGSGIGAGASATEEFVLTRSKNSTYIDIRPGDIGYTAVPVPGPMTREEGDSWNLQPADPNDDPDHPDNTAGTGGAHGGSGGFGPPDDAFDPEDPETAPPAEPAGPSRHGDEDTILSTGGLPYDAGAGDDRVRTTYAGGVTILGDTPGAVAVQGDDDLAGGSGNDRLFGMGGDDVLDGGAGDDELHGGTGNDSIEGGLGDDLISGGAGQDVIHGGAGIDLISGNWGDDQIHGGDDGDNLAGGAGNDTVHGDAGDDVLAGELGDDQIFGGLGNDSLQGGGGRDRLEGGDGNDALRGDHPNQAPDFIVADQFSDDILSGGEGNDQIYGEEGNDILDGGNGDDHLVGGTGMDSLSGGSGSDWLDGGSGADIMAGGEQNDQYVVDHAGDLVQEAQGHGTDLVRASVTWTLGANLENLVLTGEQAIDGLGNELANAITGNSQANVLHGLSGNDLLDGADGDDLLVGGEGADRLIGGLGANVLDGGLGNDEFVATSGASTLRIRSGDGHDRLTFSNPTSIDPAHIDIELSGVLAGDISAEFDGDDLLIRYGNDSLRVVGFLLPQHHASVVLGNMTLEDGTIMPLAHLIESLTTYGTEANDQLIGRDDRADRISGLGGDDIIQGQGGNDWLDGGSGNDTLVGGAGDDFMLGGDGDDEISDDAGNDRIAGGSGNDLITLGSSGGRRASVTATGDAGADRITLNDVSGDYSIDGGDGNDILVSNRTVSGAIRMDGGAGNDGLHAYLSTHAVTLDGGAGDDFFGIESAEGRILLSSGAGQDAARIRKALGDERAGYVTFVVPDELVATLVLLRQGNDLILRYGESDSMRIFDFATNLNSGAMGMVRLESSSGQPIAIEPLLAQAVLEGTIGDDTLLGLAGINDQINGSEGNDSLYGMTGDDVLSGGAGDDYLEGGGGADTLSGGDGDDSLDAYTEVAISGDRRFLSGGTGVDYMSGSSFAETYRFNVGDGADTIWEYAQASGIVDRVEFGAGLSVDAMTVTRDGFALVISFGTGTDVLRFDNWFENPEFPESSGQIEEFVFPDGTVLTGTQIEAMLDAGPVELLGTEGDDVLEVSGTAAAHLMGLAGNDMLIGATGDDLLEGGAGNDVLRGNGGVDQLSGGNGNDSLTGGSGNDVYLFGRGDGQDRIEAELDESAGRQEVLRFGAGIGPQEVIRVRTGNDLVLMIAGSADQITIADFFRDAGPGNQFNPLQRVEFSDGSSWDTVAMAQLASTGTANADASMIGTSGDDVMAGLAGNDTISGRAGNDLIDGGADNDTLYGEAGADRLFGGAGNDTVSGGDGNDRLDGGAGTDTLIGGSGVDTYLFGRGYGQDVIQSDYDTSSNRQNTLELAAGVVRSDLQFSRVGHDLVVSIAGTSDRITLSWFFYADNPNNAYNPVQQVRFADGEVMGLSELVQAAMTGTAGDDSLSGTLNGDTLDGLAGNDEVRGNGGDDSLYGGQGNDRLYGGTGSDTLDGGAGNDTLSGGLGNDTYWFGRGDGQDVIESDNESVPGKLNILKLRPDVQASDLRLTRSGDDLVVSIVGTADRVTIRMFFNQDNPANPLNPIQQIQLADGTILDMGAMSSATHEGSDAADTLLGTVWSDTLRGYGGNDQFYGRDGNDVIYGGTGNDNLRGDGGDDDLYGESGTDWIDGGQGNDMIRGGTGTDYLTGGAGNDTFRFARGDGQDYIQSDYDATATKLNVLRFDDGILASEISVRRSGDSLILAIIGSTDMIEVRGFFAGDMTNTQYNPLQEVRFEDGSVWTVAHLTEMAMRGTPGNDSIVGLTGADSLSGLDGDDHIYGRAGNDTVDGGRGNDWIWGDEGNDMLIGGDGRDVLQGGAGSDILDGGLGDDQLLGGSGNDVYRFRAGDGQDLISGDYDTSSTKHNVLEFLDGIDPSLVSVARSGDNLVISFAGRTDRVTVSYFFYNNSTSNPNNPVQEIRFMNGVIWTHSQIAAMAGQSATSGEVVGAAMATSVSAEPGGSSADDHSEAPVDTFGQARHYAESGEDSAPDSTDRDVRATRPGVSTLHGAVDDPLSSSSVSASEEAGTLVANNASDVRAHRPRGVGASDDGLEPGDGVIGGAGDEAGHVAAAVGPGAVSNRPPLRRAAQEPTDSVVHEADVPASPEHLAWDLMEVGTGQSYRSVVDLLAANLREISEPREVSSASMMPMRYLDLAQQGQALISAMAGFEDEGAEVSGIAFREPNRFEPVIGPGGG